MRAVSSGILDHARREPSNGAEMPGDDELGGVASSGRVRRGNLDIRSAHAQKRRDNLDIRSAHALVRSGIGVGCTWAMLRRGLCRHSRFSASTVRWLAVVVVLISGLGCGNVATEAPASRRKAALNSGALAMVGSEPISAELVMKVRDASVLTGDRATEQVIDVRLLGNWARQGGLAAGRRNHVSRALLARVLLEDVERRVRESPITDAEVDDATKRRWYEFDRPEARRIAHAVVKLEGTREDAAMALAQQVAKAVRGIRQGSAFLDAARAVPTGGAGRRS
ncbi:MAG: hypothetical protein QM784_23270 [Polyangiaceae bacterium]